MKFVWLKLVWYFDFFFRPNIVKSAILFPMYTFSMYRLAAKMLPHFNPRNITSKTFFMTHNCPSAKKYIWWKITANKIPHFFYLRPYYCFTYFQAVPVFFCSIIWQKQIVKENMFILYCLKLLLLIVSGFENFCKISI